MKPVNHYDPEERAREKALSREVDERALQNGEKSAAELRAQNAPFSRMKFSVDFESAKRAS